MKNIIPAIVIAIITDLIIEKSKTKIIIENIKDFISGIVDGKQDS